MVARFRFFSVPLFALTLAMAACSDDDPAAPGEVDTKPPTVSSATAIDVNHVEVTFGEDVDRASAEDRDNYSIVEATTLASFSGAQPGDSLTIVAASLKSDQRTVSFTTSDMDTLQYDMTISGVKDASGNAIKTPIVSAFTGTIDPDVTPPAIAYRSPGPNATGVPVTTSLFVTFTEGATVASLIGTTWTSTGGDVSYSMDGDDALHIVFTPEFPLALGTVYTITMPAIQDGAGNTMPNTSWSFTTTSTPDQTPPTVESSDPANLAANVPLDIDIVITFSEPMRQDDPLDYIELFPYVDGGFEWQDARSLRFNLFDPLVEDQQYALTIFPNGLRDLFGNALATVTIVFTTGNEIGSGSIAGTLRGDSQSATAGDPTGATVLVVTPEFYVMGTGVAAANNSYRIENLPDGYYLVLAYMDSNDDGDIDVGRGDAFGLLGTDPRAGDYEEDVVTINGGNHVTGANFGLFDASMITGTVWYEGTYAKEFHFVYIGLFDTNGYNPLSEPDYSTYAYWPDSPDFWFDSLDDGPSAGKFYLGAFLDANDNAAYDPGEDPAVFYDEPVMAITVENGSDVNDLFVYLEDPLPGRVAAAVAWPVKTSKRGEWMDRVSAVVRKNLLK